MASLRMGTVRRLPVILFSCGESGLQYLMTEGQAEEAPKLHQRT